MTELYSNKKSGNPPPHFYINHLFSGLSPLSGKKKYVPPKWGVGTPPLPFFKKRGEGSNYELYPPQVTPMPPTLFQKKGWFQLWTMSSKYTQ